MAALTTTHDAPTPATIENDDFWGGDIEFADFQEAYRLPSADAPESYVRQLRLALRMINDELAEWRAAREAEGQEELTEKEQEYYDEALYARAYSLLIPMLPSLFATDQADGLEDDMQGSEERFRSRSQDCVNRITGRAEPGDMAVRVF
jgi:hypothetical protein